MKNSLLTLLVMLYAAYGIATLYEELSTLEKSVVDEGLVTLSLLPVSDPQDKVVRKIYVVTVSPFSADAKFFTVLNKLHIDTKESVIKASLFQKEGEVFDEAAIRDSEIFLRSTDLVRSLAVIVPVRSKGLDSSQIDLLVATKDLLSLQPNINFKASGPVDDFIVNSATVAIGEHNLLGFNKSIAAIYEYQQSGHIAGARYFDPNLLQSRLQLTIRPSIIFAPHQFRYEGALGDFKIARPLLSERDRFGYGMDMSYGSRPIIDFNGSKVRTFTMPSISGAESFEKKYRYRYGAGSLFGRISFGTTHKYELFLSYDLNIKRPVVLKDRMLNAEQEAYYKAHILPKNEVESYINAGFSYFQNRFMKLYDYDNFRVQELKRIGPTFTISNDFSSKIFLSDHNFLRPATQLTLLQPLSKDSFIYLKLSTSNRYDGSFTDNIYKYGLTLVSPKIFDFGRAIVEGRLSMLDNHRDNQKFSLGADSGIRGVASRFYSGDKGFRANLEFRSRPFDVWITHAGFVLFYDVGAAFDTFARARPTHALGFGLRLLAPQISSEPFRIDLAFPVYGSGFGQNIVVPSFGSGQAF